MNGLTINNSGNYTISFNNSNVFSGSAIFNNSGTLTKASGVGSGTDVFNVTLNNTGTVSVQNGTLRLTGGGSSSGIFSASSGAVLAQAGSYSFTDGAQFSGAGSIHLDDGSQTTLSGTITNNGNVLFQGLNSNTYFFLGGDVTLAGSGTITLDNSGLDHIYSLSGRDTFTIGANQTIQGSGDLGANVTKIVNNGTISG